LSEWVIGTTALCEDTHKSFKYCHGNYYFRYQSVGCLGKKLIIVYL
jgi:hypothetical protein